LVALAIFIRLSLTKAAHVAVSSGAWQEIRVRSGEICGSFPTAAPAFAAGTGIRVIVGVDHYFEASLSLAPE
jgi:hypothetical protein